MSDKLDNKRNENMCKVRMGWVVSVNYYGFTQVNAIPNRLPTHFKIQLNTRHCLMFSIVK